MICKCGGPLKTYHTQTVSDNRVRRRRKCKVCLGVITTYESRSQGDTGLNVYENRLVHDYRIFSKDQRKMLWAFMRLVRQVSLSTRRQN